MADKKFGQRDVIAAAEDKAVQLLNHCTIARNAETLPRK